MLWQMQLNNELDMLAALVALRKRRGAAEGGRVNIDGLVDLAESDVLGDLFTREDVLAVKAMIQEAKNLNEEVEASQAAAEAHVTSSFKNTQPPAEYEKHLQKFKDDMARGSKWVAPIRATSSEEEIRRRLAPPGGRVLLVCSGGVLGSPPSRVEVWKIAELISELNASAQIAYTLFQTYFKSYNVHPPTCEITYTPFESSAAELRG